MFKVTGRGHIGATFFFEELSMQDRPVVVDGGNNTGIFAIVAIVVIAAIALFVWQPWNATGNGPTHSTTIINQQPAGAAGGAGTSGTSGTTSTSK